MKKLKNIISAFVLVSILMLPNAVSAEEYGKIYQRITKDGTLIVNSIEPKNWEQMELFTTNTAKDLIDDPTYIVWSDTCNYNTEIGGCAGISKNEDGTYTLPIAIQWATGEKDEYGNDKYETETHNVKVTFKESVDSTVKTFVSGLKTKLEQKEFVVTDLGYINFIYTIPKGKEEESYIDKGLLYSNEMLKTIGNSNVSYIVDNRRGNSEPWNISAAGFMTLSYNNTIVDLVGEIGVKFKPILYIPSDTEDTNEAYIAAAMKRINEYFGKDVGFKITANKKISEIVNSDGSNAGNYINGDVLDESYNGMNNKLDMTYKVEINGNTYYILIEKDSSKMETPLFGVKDTKTNISISASNGEVALDTSLKANYIVVGSDEYKLIDSKIDGEFTAIDLTLYSKIKQSNITKLENGKFEVSIPVPENLNGKVITAYYITSDGSLEEHEVKIKDGYATFETNHFSIYTLAEKNEENPQTYDGIVNSILIGVVSLTGVLGTAIYLKKRNNLKGC